MSKLLPDGFNNTDFIEDISIFSLNNSMIGQYAGKNIRGNNNLAIGVNAGKLGLDINNSLFLGPTAGSNVLNANQVISIGDDNSSFLNLSNIVNIGFNNITTNSNLIKITNDKELLSLNKIGFNNQGFSEISIGNYNSNINGSISIGYCNISTIDNSIVIGNLIKNDRFNINIDNLLCSEKNNNQEVIYLACGAYKDYPIILGSINDFSSNFTVNNFITSVFKIKNSKNKSISFKTSTNINLIYNFPLLPNNDNSFLSIDKNGNLFWLPIEPDMIKIIDSSANIICNNLETNKIIGDASLITYINITQGNTTDQLKEGVNNLYSTFNLISDVFYDYIINVKSDDITEGTNNYYFDFDKYNEDFSGKLNKFTTDDLKVIERTSNTIRFYSFDDYNKISYEYLASNNLDIINEGKSNLYFDEKKININFNLVKEGTSNKYFNFSSNFNIINSNFYLKTTDDFKEGTSNYFFNNYSINSNINIFFNDLTTDNIIVGSNLFLNYVTLYKYLIHNFPTLDSIPMGISNNYFNIINTDEKYYFNTDSIKQGTSNFYLPNKNKLTNVIATLTTSDTYKQGLSNIYYYEDIGINYFQSNIPKVTNINNIKQGTSNKFITNNFYNSDLEIKGVLKTNNLNIIGSSINLIDTLNASNLKPKIGPNTEVYSIYDYDKLFLNSRLSNIEISYCNINPLNSTNVPFIVYNNNVGINTTNPLYNLDVNGTINSKSIICSNLKATYLNATNFAQSYVVDTIGVYNDGSVSSIKIIRNEPDNDNDPKYDLNIIDILNSGVSVLSVSPNNNIGINKLNPNIIYKLDVDGDIQINDLFIKDTNISNIFVDSNILANSSNLINYYNLSNLPVIFNKTETSNIFTTKIENVWNTLDNNIYNNNNGNIGIGTTNPQYKLHITNNISANEYFKTNINISNIFVTSNILENTSNKLANYNNLYNIPPLFTKTETSNNFTTKKENVWTTTINNNIYNNNIGNVGIKTTNPQYNLDIGSASGSTGTIQQRFFNVNAGLTSGNTSINNICARFGSSIWCQSSITSSSDARIKTNIENIDSKTILDKFLYIKPKCYNFKDRINKGNIKEYGFIAQEIKEIIPEVVSIQNEFIPNIYKIGNVKLNTIFFDGCYNENNDIKINDNIKLITDNDTIIICKIINYDSQSITINQLLNENKIFVYGTEVNDFHTIAKEYLFTLNISATQELYKIIKKQQKEIEYMKAILIKNNII